RARFLLVRRAKHRGYSAPARADRFAPMIRAFAIVLAISAPAFAYNEAIHALITRTALPQADVLVQPPTQADLDAFRTLVCKRCDAWAFKEFLMLDPAARVHGFDLSPDDAAPLTRTKLPAPASRWPADAERSRP